MANTVLWIKTSDNNLRRSRKIILFSQTKTNKCLHLDGNSHRAPLWGTPIGLVNHSKVAAVRRKVALPFRRGCVCLKWIWLFFLLGWRKEGWLTVRLALCSGLPCELSMLQWAWTTVPQSGQTSTSHCFLMKSPCCVRNFHRLQVPWGFDSLVCVHTAHIKQ